MSRRKMKHRGIIALVIIIVLALLIYGLVPTILNTNPSSMKNGNSYYVAGMVTTDITYNGHSAFTLDDHGNTITVLYNGTASINTYVLVHGTYNGPFGYMNANFVAQWYYHIS